MADNESTLAIRPKTKPFLTDDLVKERLAIFRRIQARQNEAVEKQEQIPIDIELPKGARKGIAWKTTPAEIAKLISKSLFERTVIAKVDGQLWDLERPLEKSCSLQLLDFEDDEAKMVFWHSAAHVLGEAAERHLNCFLANGPPSEESCGFYYDLDCEHTVQTTDKTAIEKKATAIIKERQPFERLVMSKEELLEMFQYSEFKLHFIKTQVPNGTSSTVYRCGPLIDFCRGPHVPHTGRIKAFAVLANSATHWVGDPLKQRMIQRINGTAYPEQDLLKKHKERIAKAEKLDHRKIGLHQELFYFDELSPGSCSWFPHGAIIYNNMQNLLREEYVKRGYQEVITPNMFKHDLWKTSGHWQHYSEDMFKVEVGEETWALKPMNCPSHCRMFSRKSVSYRKLPWRLADFGVLHRNEATGGLGGLTRVRRFCQDDAHIFCEFSQIAQEITGVLEFLKYIYGLLGFEYRARLSTRPEKFLGKIETWDKAEGILKDVLEKFAPSRWGLNPGDGAFYGPKVDVKIRDALGRPFQCGTIQLDFQLPQQFDLRYVCSDPTFQDKSDEKVPQGYARPVMIHRAIWGSFERMIGILIEHTEGKWPMWLSPRHVLIVPLKPEFDDYALEVEQELRNNGIIHVEADVGPVGFQNKIKEGQGLQYNFIFVVGAEEKKGRSVNIRNRDNRESQKRSETVSLDVAIKAIKALIENKEYTNNVSFDAQKAQ